MLLSLSRNSLLRSRMLVQNIEQMNFVRFLKFTIYQDPTPENYFNWASHIKNQILIRSLFHDICFYKIQITRAFCIQHIFYKIFFHLLILFRSVLIYFTEVNKHQAVRTRKMKFVGKIFKIFYWNYPDTKRWHTPVLYKPNTTVIKQY